MQDPNEIKPLDARWIYAGNMDTLGLRVNGKGKLRYIPVGNVIAGEFRVKFDSALYGKKDWGFSGNTGGTGRVEMYGGHGIRFGACFVGRDRWRGPGVSLGCLEPGGRGWPSSDGLDLMNC